MVNDVTRNNCENFCDLTEDNNNIIIKFNTRITSCENMFYGSDKITEIDLSKFDGEYVTNMKYMFYKCSNLISINFGNMDTSGVKDMEGLFGFCSKLKSIDLSRFETTSLENSKEMFTNCESLTSLDLSNFKTSNLKSMYDMFSECHSLLTLNLSNFDTSKVDIMRGIFYNCKKLKHIDLNNFSASSLTNLWYTFCFCFDLKYLNLRNFKIVNTNSVGLCGTFSYVPSNAKYCIEDLVTKNFLLGNKDVECSDFCFQENVIFDSDSNRCICHEYYKFEYENKCYENCPNELLPIKMDIYTCLESIPSGYYLDDYDNIYKKCYEKCNTCRKTGNETFHNCDECINDFLFLNDSFAPSNNCYRICPYYYYFNINNNYRCTQNDECPLNFNKLIQKKNKCIDVCKKDPDYQYEYNNSCLIQCPENLKIDVETKHCLEDCYEYQIH